MKKALKLLLALALVLAGCSDSPRDGAPGAVSSAADPIKRVRKKVPGEYVVLLKDGGLLGAKASASTVTSRGRRASRRVTVARRSSCSTARCAASRRRMSEAQALKLAADPQVAIVEENAEFHPVDVQPNSGLGPGSRGSAATCPRIAPT